MSPNGDTKTQIGFAWFTNLGEEGNVVQIVAGTSTDFSSPDFEITAEGTEINDLPYCNSSNDLEDLAGFSNGDTRSYTSHKALATGLSTNTTYSFRIGKEGFWSPIGTFVTGNEAGNTLRFIYTADPQSKNDEYFEFSKNTTNAAYSTVPDAQFCLTTGDLVESYNSSNSEWEWEQFFEVNSEVWMNLPIAPILGNHDISSNKNFTYHFNTPSDGFDQEMSTTPGSNYSFVYGDALFIGNNTEEYNTTNYLDSLKQFICDEVAAHSDVRWKFLFFHRPLYTGGSHQTDSDAKPRRQVLIPLMDSLGIDMVFQGHDHLYEVIGVSRNYTLVDGSVTAVDSLSEGGVKANMNGKGGGIFDVTNGSLFFLNGSAGKKKYSPKTQAEMEANYETTGITNYWGMFTGKFGTTDLGTFSEVEVTYDTLFVTTYTVDDDGNTIEEYDAFKVTKNGDIIARVVTTAVSGSGSVSGAGTYEKGTTVTLTATPEDGYVFDSWTGDITGESPTLTFILDNDIDVTATFTEEGNEEPENLISVQISSSIDDVEEATNGTIYTNSSDIELVYDSYNDAGNQTVGLRFNNINIPQGATIDTAYLVFTVDETSSDETSVYIKIENSTNAPAFTTDDYNVSGRTIVQDSVLWGNIKSWTSVGETDTTPDLSNLVDSIVKLSNWESGNSMVFIITGTGARIAEAYDGDSESAARLIVEYTEAGGGEVDPSTTISVQISDNDDDVEQIGPGGDATNPGTSFSEGDIYTSSSDLEMVTDGSVQTIGLRFNEISVPKGASIDTAYITFTAKGASSDETSLYIKIENTGNASAFDDTDDFNVSDRTIVKDSVTWSSIDSWTGDETYSTPDLSMLIDSIVNLDEWASGNSMVFIIDGSGNRRAYSAKTTASAPVLVIEYTEASTANNAPTVANSIDNITVEEGFAASTLDISNVFTDADSDELTITANSSDDAVVIATVSSNSLIISEKGTGSATITLTANDGNGGTVSEAFTVTVNEAAAVNNAPVIANAIENIAEDEGFSTNTIDISNVFTDADNDELTISASSSDSTVIIATVSSTSLIISEKGIGSATITLTANDGNGGVVSDAFVVTVNDVNSAPTVANAIANITKEEGFAADTIDISNVFTDADSDELTISAVSNDSSIAIASISGNTVIIKELGTGTVTITLIADDGNGGTTSNAFSVTVNEAVGLNNSLNNQSVVTLYPNPASSTLTISGIESANNVAIYSLAGELVKVVENTNTVDVSNLCNGIYYIKAKTDKGLFIEQFIVNK